MSQLKLIAPGITARRLFIPFISLAVGFTMANMLTGAASQNSVTMLLWLPGALIAMLLAGSPHAEYFELLTMFSNTLIYTGITGGILVLLWKKPRSSSDRISSDKSG